MLWDVSRGVWGVLWGLAGGVRVCVVRGLVGVVLDVSSVGCELLMLRRAYSLR